MSHTIVTANHLLSGSVVFLAPGGRWSCSIADAALAAGPDQEDQLMAVAKQAFRERVVVDVYAVEVTVENGQPRPRRLRERIRAEGPTVAFNSGPAPGGPAAAQP